MGRSPMSLHWAIEKSSWFGGLEILIANRNNCEPHWMLRGYAHLRLIFRRLHWCLDGSVAWSRPTRWATNTCFAPTSLLTRKPPWMTGVSGLIVLTGLERLLVEPIFGLACIMRTQVSSK